MKKQMSGMLLVSILMVTLLSSSGGIAATQPTRAQKEQQALEQFAAIVEEWEVESAQRISPHLPVMPDYYCGAYLDSAGELNVVLKENAPATASAFLGQTKNNSVKTHAGTYSYNQLNQIIETINGNITPQTLQTFDFLSCYLDEEQNRVIVEIVSLTEQKKDAFRRNIYSGGGVEFKDCGINSGVELVYNNSTRFEEPQIERVGLLNTGNPTQLTLLLGTKIYVKYIPVNQSAYPTLYSWHNASLGMNVTLDGSPGFLTAGHAVVSNRLITYEVTDNNGAKQEVELPSSPTGVVYAETSPGSNVIVPIGRIINTEVFFQDSKDTAFVRLLNPQDS